MPSRGLILGACPPTPLPVWMSKSCLPAPPPPLSFSVGASEAQSGFSSGQAGTGQVCASLTVQRSRVCVEPGPGGGSGQGFGPWSYTGELTRGGGEGQGSASRPHPYTPSTQTLLVPNCTKLCPSFTPYPKPYPPHTHAHVSSTLSLRTLSPLPPPPPPSPRWPLSFSLLLSTGPFFTTCQEYSPPGTWRPPPLSPAPPSPSPPGPPPPLLPQPETPMCLSSTMDVLLLGQLEVQVGWEAGGGQAGGGGADA